MLDLSRRAFGGKGWGMRPTTLEQLEEKNFEHDRKTLSALPDFNKKYPLHSWSRLASPQNPY